MDMSFVGLQWSCSYFHNELRGASCCRQYLSFVGINNTIKQRSTCSFWCGCWLRLASNGRNVNIGTYYLIGLPVGIFVGLIFHFGVLVWFSSILGFNL